MSIIEVSVPEEVRLVRAAREGDEAAFAELARRHQAVAFRAAYLVAGSEAEAEDAVRDACLRAWLDLGRLRPSASFRPWFVAIAISEARNRRRRIGLALRLSESASRSLDPGAGRSADVGKLADGDRASLLAAVGRLREDDQLAIAARYFLGLGQADAAAALGLRRRTMKSRLSRALARLRVELGEQTP